MREANYVLDIAHSTLYILQMLILDQLTKAIEDSGLSRYKICKDLEINQGTLHRVVHGTGGCSMETLDSLCDYLGLELTVKKGD